MEMRRSLVYDPVVRTIHWWNAVTVVILVLTGEVARRSSLNMDAAVFHEWHAWFGHALVLGLVARVVWGLIGPRHARIAALCCPREWWTALKTHKLFAGHVEFGPHPLAGLVHLFFYLMLIALAITGLSLMAIKYGDGPLAAWLSYKMWLKSGHVVIHDSLSYLVWGFIVAHITALIMHDRRHGIPVAQSMLSGYQYLPDGSNKTRE
jgi:Ni,Fe-hydrogenase I cytochrome b subunit